MSNMNLNFRSKKTLTALKVVDKKLRPIKENDQIHQNKTPSKNQDCDSQPKFFQEAHTEVGSMTYQQCFLGMIQKMDPRDQRVIFPYLKQLNGFTLKDSLKDFDEWLGEMHFAVASSSFRLYTLKQISYEEVKIYLSENLLLNLLLFLEQISQTETYEVMKHLHTRLIDNLVYLGLKYPQAKDIKPNKKLREAFSVENNLENDQNDMLIPSGIKFEKKQSNDYTPQIMKVLNYLVSITSQKCRYLSKQTTYYNAFSQLMQKIFESVENPEEVMSEDELFAALTWSNQNLSPEMHFTDKQPRSKQQIKSIKLSKKVIQANGTNNNIQYPASEDESVQTRPISPLSEKEHSRSQEFEPNKMQQFPEKEPREPRQPKESKELKEPQEPKQFEPTFLPAIHYTPNYPPPKFQPEIFAQQKKKNKKVMNEKQLKQYKEKVKKYTSYRIGQKINPNTELYSQNQINQSRFEVKATAILRVLTKWISELEAKIFNARELIMNRSFRFKSNKNTFIKLSSSEKNSLYQGAQKKIPLLKSYFNEIINQCMEIEGILAKGSEIDMGMANIPKYQYLVGRFCARLESAASTYLVSYLNKIIQSLLQIPSDLDQDDREVVTKCKNVNLITFKVSDLMRCKCSSRESEVLRIFSIIKRISDQKPYLFKIVRIKDRLQLSTRDILINVIFMNKILCQIQLAINDEVEQKQKMFDAFGHFLYELRRSNLGPIMEASCIWTHLDQRSKAFKKLVPKNSSDIKTINYRKHICQAYQMVPYSFAFVCSLCGVFYSSPTSLIGNKKCQNCKKHYECNRCIEKKMNQSELKEFLGLHSKEMKIFDQEFKLWDIKASKELPNFAIFIPKKHKHISYIFGQKLAFKESIYYITTIQNAEHKVEAKTIFTLKSDSQRHINEMLENYIVFEWQEKRYVNKTITAAKQREQRELEKLKREKQLETRKKNMEIAKEEIKARKKQQQRRWKGLMAVEEEDSNESDEDLDDKSEGKKGGKKRKESKQSPQDENLENENPNKRDKILKMFIPNLGGSRPGTGSSKGSKSSKPKKHQQKQIFVEVLAKVSQHNDFRVCSKKFQNCTYSLILGYYRSVSDIRHQLKQNLNQTHFVQLLSNRNQVLFLQQSAISEKVLMDIPNVLTVYRKALASVSQIYLDENKIVSLDIIADFPKLRVLHANHNYISKIKCLEKLKYLTEIMLINNNIYDIQGLQNKPRLLNLQLGRNHIEEIQKLDGVPNVTTLSLYGNQISIIQNLENLDNLIELDLSMNLINNINGLKNLGGLETLYLNSNKIMMIENLDALKQLKVLSLSRNQIAQIQNLDHLKRLQSLSLEKNQIKQIKNLQALQNLRELNLGKNQIEKVQNLDNLPNLRFLNLAQNRIQMIEQDKFQHLSALQRLNIGFNRLRDISHYLIEFLPLLKELNIINNPINKNNMENKEVIEKIKKKVKSFIASAI